MEVKLCEWMIREKAADYKPAELVLSCVDSGVMGHGQIRPLQTEFLAIKLN